MFSAFVSQSQNKADNSPPLSFPDSVRIILENTRNVDASVVGAGFSTAWNSLGIDQQIVIQKQVRQMKRMKIALRPGLTNYFGALASAVNGENANPSKVASFLNVTTQVLETEKAGSIQNFFKVSRTFIQHHALYYDKTYKLYARDDEYTFDYITPAPVFDLNDSYPASDSNTSSSDDLTEEEEPYSSDSNDEYQEQPADFFSEAPLWMNPMPPPVVEGPVIRFNKITLNFVTRYDSIFLQNSTG